MTRPPGEHALNGLVKSCSGIKLLSCDAPCCAPYSSTATAVNKVADNVLKVLQRPPLSETRGIFGLDDQVAALQNLVTSAVVPSPTPGTNVSKVSTPCAKCEDITLVARAALVCAVKQEYQKRILYPEVGSRHT